jgi:hypothetical protein
MLVRDRLGTPVTEVGSLLDVRRIRKLKTLGHTENHQVLNFASEGIWVSGLPVRASARRCSLSAHRVRSTRKVTQAGENDWTPRI